MEYTPGYFFRTKGRHFFHSSTPSPTCAKERNKGWSSNRCVSSINRYEEKAIWVSEKKKVETSKQFPVGSTFVSPPGEEEKYVDFFDPYGNSAHLWTSKMASGVQKSPSNEVTL
ncbi:hypothetical protein TNCV_2866101 [Trichonephila clavipes]|nr:hypothetical protein TNCV_2866101 [Trichonephila clavipes]